MTVTLSWVLYLLAALCFLLACLGRWAGPWLPLGLLLWVMVYVLAPLT